MFFAGSSHGPFVCGEDAYHQCTTSLLSCFEICFNLCICMYLCHIDSLSCRLRAVGGQVSEQGAWCLDIGFRHMVSTLWWLNHLAARGERGNSVVECRTPEREVRGSRPTAAVLCPWARHFTPRKYWLVTQEAMAPSRYDWKIVDWDVKPQHNQPTLRRVTGMNFHYRNTSCDIWVLKC